MGIEIEPNEMTIKDIIENTKGLIAKKFDDTAQQLYGKQFNKLSLEQVKAVLKEISGIPIDPNELADIKKLIPGLCEELAQNIYEKPYKELSLKQREVILMLMLG